MKSILVIEDDRIQADELIHRLGKAGYRSRHIATELEFEKNGTNFDRRFIRGRSST